MFPNFQKGGVNLTDHERVNSKIVALGRVCDVVEYAMDPDRKVVSPLVPDALMKPQASYGWLGSLNARYNWIGVLTTVGAVAALANILHSAHITELEYESILKFSLTCAARTAHVAATPGLFDSATANASLLDVAGATSNAAGMLLVPHENMLVCFPHFGIEAVPTALSNAEVFSLVRPNSMVDSVTIRIHLPGYVSMNLGAMRYIAGAGPMAAGNHNISVAGATGGVRTIGVGYTDSTGAAAVAKVNTAFSMTSQARYSIDAVIPLAADTTNIRLSFSDSVGGLNPFLIEILGFHSQVPGGSKALKSGNHPVGSISAHAGDLAPSTLSSLLPMGDITSWFTLLRAADEYYATKTNNVASFVRAVNNMAGSTLSSAQVLDPTFLLSGRDSSNTAVNFQRIYMAVYSVGLTYTRAALADRGFAAFIATKGF
jgi:hypothetical protein